MPGGRRRTKRSNIVCKGAKQTSQTRLSIVIYFFLAITALFNIYDQVKQKQTFYQTCPFTDEA